MGAIKEYVCLAHGEFDAESPVCPYGCTTAVDREFRTAPAARSAKTTAADKALARLAISFGYTDMSNRSGSVAASQKPGGRPPPDFTPRWESVPPGDVFHKGGQIESRDGSKGGATAAATKHGTGVALGPQLGVSAEPLASNAVPLPLGALPPKPRPHVVGHDNVNVADFQKAVRSAT